MSTELQELEKRLAALEQKLVEHAKSRESEERREMRRMSFEFTPEAYDYLQSEARTSGTSMASVIRDALSKKQWVDNAIQEGSLLVEENGEVRRVVSP